MAAEAIEISSTLFTSIFAVVVVGALPVGRCDCEILFLFIVRRFFINVVGVPSFLQSDGGSGSSVAHGYSDMPSVGSASLRSGRFAASSSSVSARA